MIHYQTPYEQYLCDVSNDKQFEEEATGTGHVQLINCDECLEIVNDIVSEAVI